MGLKTGLAGEKDQTLVFQFYWSKLNRKAGKNIKGPIIQYNVGCF
jgi:hypothetical protein